MSMLPILYRGFYDVPRAILVEAKGSTLFLESLFDERVDGYTDFFRVYRLRKSLTEASETSNWCDIAADGIYIGVVPVSEVRFDASRRAAVDDVIFAEVPSSDEITDEG